ncbi:MAG TPA: PAS domain-containing protein [Hansschlegelia sp.]
MEVASTIYTRIIFQDVPLSAEDYLTGSRKAMLDATQDCIKIISTDGRLLMMNRAGCVALNVPEDSDFGMPWLSLLPESVRDRGLEALHHAAAGDSARFPGQSLSPNGTMFWDNLLTPITDDAGQVLSILCVSRDVTEKTRLELALEAAIEREALISREMQHRVKNLFSVVAGLIRISEKESQTYSPPRIATELLGEKISALARAFDAAFSRDAAHNSDPSSVDLVSLIGSVLMPYGDRCKLTGEKICLNRNILTTIALFLHEMATNSVKYGSLSSESGMVTIVGTGSANEVNLRWVESGGPAISKAPIHEGFGSQMIDRIVTASGGEIKRDWPSHGIVAELILPNAA